MLRIPLVEIVVYGTVVPYTPFLLPYRPRFFSHCERFGRYALAG